MPKPEEIEEAIRRVLTEHIKRGELISPKVKQLLGGMLSSEAQTGERRPAPQKPTKPAPAKQAPVGRAVRATAPAVRPAPAKQAPVGRAVRATAPAARPAPATRRPAVHPSPRPPVVTRGIGAMTPAAAALAGEHEALMPPLPPLEPQVASLPTQTETASLLMKGPFSLIPPAETGISTAARTERAEIPPPPTKEEPKPPPPATPLEMQLREKFNDPGFLRHFIMLSLNFPEQAQRLLGVIATVAPRAFVSEEREFEQKWMEAEERRVREDFSNRINIWRTQIEAEIDKERLNAAQQAERARALLDSAKNVSTLEDFASVYNQAASLTPAQFTLIRTQLLWRLPYILFSLKSAGTNITPVLRFLVENGYLRESEARNIMASLTSKEALRDLYVGQAQMWRDHITRIWQEYGNWTDPEWNTEQQGISAELEGIINSLKQMDIETIEATPQVVDTLMRRLGQIADRVAQFEARAMGSMERGLRTYISEMNKVVREALRGGATDVNSVVRMATGIANTFSHPVAVSLIGSFRNLIDKPVELLNAVANSFESMANEIETKGLMGRMGRMWAATLRAEAELYRAQAQEFERRQEAATAYVNAMHKLLQSLPPTTPVTLREQAQANLERYRRFSEEMARRRLALEQERISLQREGLGIRREALEQRERMFSQAESIRRLTFILNVIRTLGTVRRMEVSRDNADEVMELVKDINTVSSALSKMATTPGASPAAKQALTEVRDNLATKLQQAVNAVKKNPNAKVPVEITPLSRQADEMLRELIDVLENTLETEILPQLALPLSEGD